MIEKAYSGPGAHVADWWPAVRDPLRTLATRAANFFTPNSDAAITDEAYEINVELPGVAEEDIEITVHDGVLNIKGEKHAEREQEGRSYYFSERSYGVFQRSFRLPQDAKPDQVMATFKEGVLSVRIAKMSPEVEVAHKIKISKG